MFVTSVASIRVHMAFNALFGFLTLTFLLLAIGQYYIFFVFPTFTTVACADRRQPLGQLKNSLSVTKAGGGFGIATAFVAYYAGASELITPETACVDFSRPFFRKFSDNFMTAGLRCLSAATAVSTRAWSKYPPFSPCGYHIPSSSFLALYSMIRYYHTLDLTHIFCV